MFLGVDIGTSAVKVVVVDTNGSVVEQSSRPLKVHHPAPLMSEQNPQDWWVATDQAVKGLSSKVRSGIDAIGLTGQMHGATLLNAADGVIRPAILWNDGRSFGECQELETDFPLLMDITGNRAMPGFTAPKILWLKKYEPDAFENVSKILLPKDYVRLLMSGDYASDTSDSSGTLWMNTGQRHWSDAIIAVCGLFQDQLPRLFEGNAFTGTLRRQIANDWGMKDVPIGAGAGDNAAGAIGVGIINKGEGLLSLGTSGVIFTADADYRANPQGNVHAFCHALPDRWHLMSVMLNAAGALSWASALLGFKNVSDFVNAAETRGRPCRSEIFLPYLTGERTPHNDPFCQGVYFGLTANTDNAAIAHATLEGVAFGLADGLDALVAAGAEVDSLSVAGGGAQSKYWATILASALNLPIVYREGSTIGPAYGASRLARLALTGEEIESVCSPPEISHVVEPFTEQQDQLAARREIFQKTYKQLSPLFRENSQ